MKRDAIGEEIERLKSLRDRNRGNDAGRYYSMAITALEEARHWLEDAEQEIDKIDSMAPGGAYKD